MLEMKDAEGVRSGVTGGDWPEPPPDKAIEDMLLMDEICCLVSRHMPDETESENIEERARVIFELLTTTAKGNLS